MEDYQILKEKMGISTEQFYALEDLPDEDWRYLADCKNLYMISNYGRVKANTRYDKRGRELKAKILSQTYNKANGQTLIKVRIDGKQKTLVIKNLMETYFPKVEHLEKKAKKEAEKRDKDFISKTAMRYAKYITYNINTGEEKYYKSMEQINEVLNIPLNIIERVIENQIPDFMGLKIYVTKLGGKDYCGK